MIIEIPKEIGNNENHVSLTPAGVLSLVELGHIVLIGESAGLGSGFPDEECQTVGGTVYHREEVLKSVNLIVKVKEYLEDEYQYLREDQIVSAYLYTTDNEPSAETLMKSRTTAIAYETVIGKNNSLPLLTPMSEVAERVLV